MTDRFIPRRPKSVEITHYKLLENEKPNDTLSREPECNPVYKMLLRSLVGYENTKILTFYEVSSKNTVEKEKSWPVIIRSKPVFIGPRIVLDIPDLCSEVRAHIIDWSRTGYLTTIWDNVVYVWHNEKKGEAIETNIPGFKALKWNNAGTQLAVANRSFVSIWQMPEQKIIMNIKKCLCLACYCTCLLWDKTDKYLITGCSSGLIVIWDTKEIKLEIFLNQYIFDSIIRLEFCPYNKFLCSSTAYGRVQVWLWPSLKKHMIFNYRSYVKALAFHPWKAGLLAIGGGIDDGTLSLWDLNTSTKIDYMKPEEKSFVDYLTFNPITGELVASYQILDSQHNYRTKILVLSSFNHVVDYTYKHHGRVLYMFWNETGSKLATVSTDENIFVWNFLPKAFRNINLKNKAKEKTKQARCFQSNFSRCSIR